MTYLHTYQRLDLEKELYQICLQYPLNLTSNFLVLERNNHLRYPNEEKCGTLIMLVSQGHV